MSQHKTPFEKIFEGLDQAEVERLIEEALADDPTLGGMLKKPKQHRPVKLKGADSRLDLIGEAYVAQAKPYDLTTESLSQDIKTAHLELYRGYTEQLTNISAKLDAVQRKGIDANTSEFRSLKYDELFHLNAVHLHELYFANISDVHSEVRHDSLAYMRLQRDFGTFDDWQFDFKAACESAGNGWGMCVYSTFLQRFINVFVTSHVTNIPVGCYPVIVMDMHEHAYYADYKNNVRGYIIKMMQELNWEVIEERIKRADMIQKAMEA